MAGGAAGPATDKDFASSFGTARLGQRHEFVETALLFGARPSFVRNAVRASAVARSANHSASTQFGEKKRRASGYR